MQHTKQRDDEILIFFNRLQRNTRCCNKEKHHPLIMICSIKNDSKPNHLVTDKQITDEYKHDERL